MSHTKGLLVCCTVENGTPSNVGLELITEGRRLASELGEALMAAVIGHEAQNTIKELSCYGVSKLYVADRSELAFYTAQAYADAMELVIKKENPSIVLVGATTHERDTAARVAASLKTGLTADCTQLEIDPENRILLQTRPAYGGNVTATIVCAKSRPQMASVRPGVFTAKKVDNCPAPEIVDLSKCPVPELKGIEVLSRRFFELDEDRLRYADIVVACGRGVRNESGVALAKEFASAVGGEIAASRGAVEDGLLPRNLQVGQTGRTIRPRVYIACGISGAIQHLVGMQGSDCVIAINSDPHASIFNSADYGICGDLRDVLPKLSKQK